MILSSCKLNIHRKKGGDEHQCMNERLKKKPPMCQHREAVVLPNFRQGPGAVANRTYIHILTFFNLSGCGKNCQLKRPLQRRAEVYAQKPQYR